MALTIHINVIDEDAPHWGPPAASAIPIDAAHLPEVGDMLLIDGTHWSCKGRIWSRTGNAVALDLWLARVPEWTAARRRSALTLVPSLPKAPRD